MVSRQPDSQSETWLLDERYLLGRVLGRGGEATVHLARDQVLDRDVAVKLFHRQIVPPSAGHLREAEAHVGAALHHYALVALFDSGVAVGPEGVPQLYVVMEYIPGESLHARLLRGPLEVSEACWLGFDLAEGLDSMHQTGFVHRDVKPGNILISSVRSVRPVVAKLTDFGIAARLGQPDLSEFTVGTAAYLSPEQVEGHDAGAASDTYSLGLVLLQAMTGPVAFPGSVMESAFARLSEDPPIPAQVPARVAALLRRMTTRSPGARISLYEAAVELQQILVDDLVQRRNSDAHAQPELGTPDDFRDVTIQAQPGFESVLRLLAGATDSPYTLLMLEEPGRGLQIAAMHGWAGQPLEMQAEPVTPPAHLERGVWAVPALLDEPSLAGHPIAGGEHNIAAIAAAPLLDRTRRVIGMIYACDVQKRDYNSDHLAALVEAAGLILREIQLRQAVRRVLFPEP